jgi:uncharacterized membrane protein
MEDLLDPIYGEIAGIFTAICWAFTSSFFAMSGSIIGSVNVNRLRLAFAAGMLIITHYFYFNSFLPLDASPERWFWLGLSGLVGFVIGDAMLFEAFVIVGARISMLLMSLVPIMSALFAWLFLGEILTLFEIFVICVTVGLGKRKKTVVGNLPGYWRSHGTDLWTNSIQERPGRRLLHPFGQSYQGYLRVYFNLDSGVTERKNKIYNLQLEK